jgi:hypothetical protein
MRRPTSVSRAGLSGELQMSLISRVADRRGVVA